VEAPSSPARLTPGSVLGGYVVEARIGAGGMGEVWRARDPSLLRHVALKVLSPEANASPSIRARFVREGRAAAALVHPNVVTVFGAGEDADRTYLVMELGGTLRSRRTSGLSASALSPFCFPHSWCCMASVRWPEIEA
jgi:serine/threonine-protein kinase